jgi:hypothetical protein
MCHKRKYQKQQMDIRWTKYSTVLKIWILVILLVGCTEDSSVELKNKGIVRITYGTSFGFCVGYCVRDLDITETEILFSKSGWVPEVEEVMCTDRFFADDWEVLVSKVDIQAFMSLPEVIGCPDCADGGSEWLELVLENKRHKVTFEFSKEPDEISAVIEELRAYLDAFEDCED